MKPALPDARGRSQMVALVAVSMTVTLVAG